MLSTQMQVRPDLGRWDGERMYFEINERDRRVACSVSREALEEAGPGRNARPWQLRETFTRLRHRIEIIARDKFRAGVDMPGRVIMVSSFDLNDPAPAAPAAALRKSA
ncbi:MAG TPA: DUF1488 family protein [Acetobacteraceae bacterium]|nr:DUF1488 family protein [Acetobacteraceae bacterium]